MAIVCKLEPASPQRAKIEVSGGFDDPRENDKFVHVVRMDIIQEGSSVPLTSIALTRTDAKALAAQLERLADNLPRP